MKRTGSTRIVLKSLIQDLKRLSFEKKIPLWKRIANDLDKPTRQRREVNIYKLNKYAVQGETLIVPGKVLSSGDITKKITVGALSFSSQAKDKINKIGKAVSIRQLMQENPQGKKIKIIG